MRITIIGAIELLPSKIIGGDEYFKKKVSLTINSADIEYIIDSMMAISLADGHRYFYVNTSLQEIIADYNPHIDGHIYIKNVHDGYTVFNVVGEVSRYSQVSDEDSEDE